MPKRNRVRPQPGLAVDRYLRGFALVDLATGAIPGTDPVLRSDASKLSSRFN